MRIFFATYLLILLLGASTTIQAQDSDSQDEFLDDVAQRTYAYLSSDWATSQHLPYSWRSEQMEGGDYTNTTEIALLMLSHLGAYELQRDWSPEWETVDSEINAILDQLLAWQSGEQSSQPNGDNTYEDSVFYQWYWIGWEPPVVGAGDGDHVVPSIDNAFIAAALITIRAYALEHDYADMAEKADQILNAMDFRLWYNEDNALFRLGSPHDPQGGVYADYYSNENRIINFVARALGQLSTEEFQASLDALVQNPASYGSGEDVITVERVAWDGSYFTYMAPGLFIREVDTPYFEDTIIPATEGQIAYANNAGFSFWGLSDTYDIGDRGYIGQGAAPAATASNLQTTRGVISPHVSGMALVTPFREEAILNLQQIAELAPTAYHPEYGFYDSVMANPESSVYGEASIRFTAIAQGWLFVSLVNAESGVIWDYFYQDEGVQAADSEMFSD